MGPNLTEIETCKDALMISYLNLLSFTKLRTWSDQFIRKKITFSLSELFCCPSFTLPVSALSPEVYSHALRKAKLGGDYPLKIVAVTNDYKYKMADRVTQMYCFLCTLNINCIYFNNKNKFCVKIVSGLHLKKLYTSVKAKWTLRVRQQSTFYI